jgi:hypothetical protein
VIWVIWRAGLWWDRHRLRHLQYRYELYGDVSDVAVFGAMRRVQQRELGEPSYPPNGTGSR